MSSPIKRNELLKPYSRDHHHGLLLCWKIKVGLQKNIELNRISNYVSSFWNSHLKAHFLEEDKYVFTVLPANDEHIMQAIKEHNSLRANFEKENMDIATVQNIEKELNAHIRFEERLLFNKIQEAATEAQLQQLNEHYNNEYKEEWNDEFWLN